MSESLSQQSTSDDEYVLPAPVDVHPDDPIVHGLRWRRERDEARAEVERLRNLIGELYVGRGRNRWDLYVAIKRAFRDANASGRERASDD